MAIRSKVIEQALKSQEMFKPDVQMGIELLKDPEMRQKVKENAAGIEVASDTPLMTDEKKQVWTTLDNQEKMRQISEEPEENLSLTNKFALAAAAFAPTILGAIFEGTEGAAAAAKGTLTGAKAGLDLAKGFQELEQAPMQQELRQTGFALERRRADLAERRLELEEREALTPPEKKFQQTGNLLKSTGEPVIFEQTTGRFLTGAGEVVDPSQVVSGVQSRFMENLDLSKKQKAQLSDKQVADLAALDIVDTQLNRVSKLQEDVITGPVAGRAQSLLQIADVAPEKFTELETELNSILANYTKAISGAQVSDAEAQRLAKIIPSTNLPPKTFQARLKTFSRIIQDNKEEIQKSIQSGQPLRRETINKMLETASDVEEPKVNINDQRKRLEELRKKYGRE